jgi:Protein of unknown function (DUF3024)
MVALPCMPTPRRIRGCSGDRSLGRSGDFPPPTLEMLPEAVVQKVAEDRPPGRSPRHEAERWHTEPMSPATPPELDIARVHIWCRQRVPEGLHNELRIECDVDAGQVTIYEARPPWQPDLGPEWIRSPVAQLRYTATSRAWTLYWPDRNLRWRQYRDVPAGRPVEELLDEIGRDPTGIFWG